MIHRCRGASAAAAADASFPDAAAAADTADAAVSDTAGGAGADAPGADFWLRLETEAGIVVVLGGRTFETCDAFNVRQTRRYLRPRYGLVVGCTAVVPWCECVYCGKGVLVRTPACSPVI